MINLQVSYRIIRSHVSCMSYFTVHSPGEKNESKQWIDQSKRNVVIILRRRRQRCTETEAERSKLSSWFSHLVMWQAWEKPSLSQLWEKNSKQQEHIDQLWVKLAGIMGLTWLMAADLFGGVMTVRVQLQVRWFQLCGWRINFWCRMIELWGGRN